MARTTRTSSVARAARPRASGAKHFADTLVEISDNIEKVVKGKREVIRFALVCLFAQGHLLFEDVPGTGKSTLARAIAQSIDGEVNRIQCTPDMLPADITGTQVLDPKSGTFSFHQGPVFTNVLLADEINRATPKTQSALLEAMAERYVTVYGTTHPLPQPFSVIATQNPVELAGTFPLPEAQLDRFLMKLSMGYPNAEAEMEAVRSNRLSLAIDDLGAVVDVATVNDMIGWASGVTVSDQVLRYIVDVCQATRDDASFLLGASPRAVISLVRAASVMAAADSREDVYIDDVKALLRPVLAHRLMLSPDALLRGESVDNVLERVLVRVKPPLMGKARAAAGSSLVLEPARAVS